VIDSGKLDMAYPEGTCALALFSRKNRFYTIHGHQSRQRSSGTGFYQDGNSGGEYMPVEMKSIPWNNPGSNKLTVKLALWWIHVLAAAPGCDMSINQDYPWELADGGYCHIATGLVSKEKPKSGRIFLKQSSQGPSTLPPWVRGIIVVP
jgi:hypothetical protein